jgi:glyoxylase I family protein
MHPSGIHHLAIKVADLSSAEAFYAGLLRLPVARRWPSADGTGERSIWIDLGGDSFLAIERAAAAGTSKDEEIPGIHLVALRIDRQDRDAWKARLADAGHAVYLQTDYTLYVRDPEGNRVGLSHWPERA